MEEGWEIGFVDGDNVGIGIAGGIVVVMMVGGDLGAEGGGCGEIGVGVRREVGAVVGALEAGAEVGGVDDRGVSGVELGGLWGFIVGDGRAEEGSLGLDREV